APFIHAVQEKPDGAGLAAAAVRLIADLCKGGFQIGHREQILLHQGEEAQRATARDRLIGKAEQRWGETGLALEDAAVILTEGSPEMQQGLGAELRRDAFPPGALPGGRG